jgi:hypothetical protein
VYNDEEGRQNNERVTAYVSFRIYKKKIGKEKKGTCVR